MAKQKYTHRLPQPRVSESLFDKVQQVAAAQELGISDVIRLALEDYCSPPDTFPIPIVGTLTNMGIELRRKDLARYLEVEPVGEL